MHFYPRMEKVIGAVLICSLFFALKAKTSGTSAISACAIDSLVPGLITSSQDLQLIEENHEFLDLIS